MLSGLPAVIFSLFFVGAGGILLLLAVAIMQTNYRLLKKGSFATGTIVRFEADTDVEGTTAYFPVVRFWTKTETEIEFRHFMSRDSFPRYKLNQAVKVIYDPENPQQAKIKAKSSLWTLPIGLSLLSLLFFLVAFFALSGDVIVRPK